MTIEQYIQSLNERYRLGNSTEHTYRGDLQRLIESLVPDMMVTNEPKRRDCGAPDYILTKKDIPLGFIEVKDIGDTDLEGKKKSGNKEQFDRYKASLSNLIFSDYLDFHLYRDEELITKIAIGEVVDGEIKPLRENFDRFTNLIKDFSIQYGITIRSPKKLAKMMAGKARLLSDIIEKSLNSDEVNAENSTLKDQLYAFKEILIHDITPKGFADVYAQTIAYGMFAARLHDPTLENFSRHEAAQLIPRSNPFLRRLFQYIAGYDLDDRIKWVVDDLVQIFLACNVEEMLNDYGKATKMEDPIIHFYEDFLAEYDPKLRKARGVWYTPQPVVNFIVRAVDEVLKTEFGLQGLSDTSKTKIKVDVQGKKVEKEVHKVQILDPATGTGTFLAETVKHIHQKFKGQQGIWNQYVDEHLKPRLNGFELLMASYAMAHLKLDLLLKETGYTSQNNDRLRVYLTNSLEESHPDTGTLFANWLSSEANEANYIKRDTPVMVVMGNPPYSVSSSNKGDWIESLVADYKKDLNERNIQPLSDDYIKFIRFGQYFIEKTGEGILAYISNNSFIDGIIHRKMREELISTFDKIYILDLHGNSKKKEVAPDGGPDQNVFDIMQGVSINIFVIKSKKPKGQVFHFDLFGKRESKYDFLINKALNSINWTILKIEKPNFFFVYKDTAGQKEYEKGFKIDEILIQGSSGVETRKDFLTISMDKVDLEQIRNDFIYLNVEEIMQKYNVDNKSRDWKVEWAKEDISRGKSEIHKTLYKPFDKRYIIYSDKSKGIIGYPMYNNFQHSVVNPNHNLCLMKKLVDTIEFRSVFISNGLIDKNLYGFQTYAFPLYLYPDNTASLLEDSPAERIPNLNKKIVDQIAKGLKLEFEAEKSGASGKFAPIDLLDYIYAVLHSPSYREKYKEFLKIDFPRVPYPKNQDKFWKLVELGSKLRQIHLLESLVVENYITQYPISGDNTITRRLTKNSIGFEPAENGLGRVWINDKQYFDKVPLVAWEFYIGGYQPAQKWLKDRRNRQLDFEDILHYQKIIVALTETDRIMGEIEGMG